MTNTTINLETTRQLYRTDLPQTILEPLLTGARRREFLAGTVAWIACLIFFWAWWLKPAHNIDNISYLFLTFLQAWVTLLPGYFLFVFLRSKKPVGPVSLPPGSRVAMVVTKAPSEPFHVVRTTLEAMLAQDFPHDTWLADEDPTPETLAWCGAHDVKVSCRKGITEYHRKEWPRRTRCKEGNLAYFYDLYGYRNYDFVSQLDADHVPQPGYLSEMMRPFADPKVGYVSAPSVCDKNAAGSWAARGRLFVEATMHGPLQAGYNGGWAPLCIGSHYAVRTSALREIGGLGPELAEDHSTTLMLNAHGWRGVHAIDAHANGDGPKTFTDLITQEFQWSRSLMMILLKYTPKYLGRLPVRLKFQFLFSQLWYPLFALFMASCVALPILALLLKRTFVDVTYPAYLVHLLPMPIVLTVMVWRLRSYGLLRPHNSKLIAWEIPLFLFARWPWVLAGAAAAVHDWLTNSYVDFRVTPKGTTDADPLPTRVLAPYVFLSLVSALPALLVQDPQYAASFALFALLNAAIYTAVYMTIVFRHEDENRVRHTSYAYRPATFAVLFPLMLLPVLALQQNGLRGLDAISYGTRYFALTDRIYPVAGAGQGGRGVWNVTFNPHWIPYPGESDVMEDNIRMASNG